MGSSFIKSPKLKPGRDDRLLSVLPSSSEALFSQLSGEVWGVCARGGEIIGIAGIEPQWRGRAVLWSFHVGLPMSSWGRVLRFAKLRLGRSDFHRIEATARTDEPAHKRFLQRLGFEEEGVLRQYDQNKNSYFMMAKIK